jgi:hypothetical protein
VAARSSSAGAFAVGLRAAVYRGYKTSVISPGRLWWLLRRDFKRGWEASYHHYKTLPRIAEWSWPFWNERPMPVPVHVLTGQNDYLLAAWMLASWFHFTEHAWPVVIHDDGTLPEEGRALFRKLFPPIRIIDRREADAAIEPLLRPFPFCADYRRKHPLALKVFDIPHFASGERFLVFDSDVLFFSYPSEIITWVKDETDECRFNEDAREGSLITAAEARAELNLRIWPRVNSGLCLMVKSIVDLDLCDRALAQTSIPSGHVWRIEQTLLMLCAARYGKGGLLPNTYEVSLGRNAAPDVIARHYVGAVRDRYFAEGLKRLQPILLPREPESSAAS